MESIITSPSAESRWNAIYLANRPQRWWPNEQLIRYVSKVYGQDGGKGLTALELGCGTGRNLWFLAECGFTVYGLDVAPTVLSLCDTYLTGRGATNARLGRADLTNGLTHCIEKAFGPTQFDFIVDDRTMQHMMWSQHQPLYEEACSTVLKPNGRFFSQHLGADCTDMRYGVTKFIDECTAENVSGANTVFPENGLVCMPRHENVVNCLQNAGLIVELAEQIFQTTVSEDNSTLVTHYLVLGARK